MPAPRSELPPKIITLAQRTPEWHAWRNGEDLPDKALRVTASAMSQIMGASPYGNAYDLWMEVTRRKPQKVANIAMQRGITLEPEARAEYIAFTGIHVEDACVEHPTCPWMAASLDGLSTAFGDSICEIKVPGAEDHYLAMSGKVPSKYVPQVQWQLLVCTSAQINHYWSYYQGKGALVEVYPDARYQDLLYEAAEAFRLSVIDDVPPCSAEFIEQALKIRALYRKKKDLERLYFEATDRLKALGPAFARSSSFAGVSLSRSENAGSIDYDGLLTHLGVKPELVEQYRKAPDRKITERVTVNLDAEIPVFGFAQPAQAQAA